MHLSRRSIWIPCLLSAVAINVLIFLPRAPVGDARPSARPEEQPDFWLSTRVYEDSEKHRDKVSLGDQDAALQRTSDEITKADAAQYWVGAYRRTDGWYGRYHRLILGTDSYVLTYVDLHSDSAPDWLVVEFGALERSGELLRFDSRGRSPDTQLPRELICVHDGTSHWLAEPWLVPAAFYPNEQSERPFPSVRGAGYIAEEHALAPLDRPEIPEAYTRERERLGSFRLVAITAPREAGGATSASFERLSNAEIAPFDQLWWDGEVCTRLRARVSEVQAGSVTAEFDWPGEAVRERLAPGAIFTRLPRLE